MATDLPGVNVKLTIPGTVNPKGWQELPRDSDGTGYELAVLIPGTDTLVRLHPSALENRNVTISYGMLRVASYVSKAWTVLDNAPVYCRPVKERLPGGRPPKGDWPEWRGEFFQKCKKDGALPNKLNAVHWRTYSDGARWLAGLVDLEKMDEDDEPSFRALWGYVKTWSEQFRALEKTSMD